MANFEVLIYPVTIEPHPNADAIELAVIGEYRSIVQKDTLKNGDLVAYIPEASIVPDWILESMNLVGKLAGKKKNRVKAIRLRGIMSEGICYPLTYLSGIRNLDDNTTRSMWALPLKEIGGSVESNIGDNVTELLGITKYEPIIPTHMGGEVFNAHGYTISYDIENWKKFPDVIEEGEMVGMTEKAHGTWGCFGYHPEVTTPIVTSKGLSGKGLAFKFNEANENNLYIKAFNSTIDESGDDCVTRNRRLYPSIEAFYILVEIFGPGVQDLHYGVLKPTIAAFDIYVGSPGTGHYLNRYDFTRMCDLLNIPTVPLLYKGPFSRDIMLEHTDGKERISGTNACIREGLVIKPIVERRDYALGRVILKSVSDAYLNRKNGTEFN